MADPNQDPNIPIHRTPPRSRQSPGIRKFKKWLKRENNKSGIANIIAFVALVIGGFLAVYTYKVFNLSQKQAQSVIDAGNAAKRSADIAEKTFIADTTYTNQNVRNQKITDIKADSLQKIRSEQEKLTFERQDGVLKTQIASLKESQKQFENTNNAIMQVSKIQLSYGLETIKVTYTIINEGKQGGKILESAAEIFPAPVSTVNTITINENNSPKVNLFISPGTSADYFLELPIDTDELNTLKTGNSFVYFEGRFKYLNFATKKIYRLSFLFRLSIYTGLDDKEHKAVYSVINDVDEIKK